MPIEPLLAKKKAQEKIMNTLADKTLENKNHLAFNRFAQDQKESRPAFQFADNRPEAIQMRKLQEVISNAKRAKQLKAPIQRAVVVDGELWATAQDMANSELNIQELMEAIEGIEYLADPPENIQAAINDQRLFHLWKNGDYYEADVTRYLENQGEPTNRQHLEVNTAPGFVRRGDLPQTMRISGLISCVAIIIEAGNQDGTQLLIGMHYTTGYHTENDGTITPRGTNALQSMALLLGGYQMTRVHLCHPLQVNGSTHEGTTANLQNLRAYFGAGICQTHVLGQTHVTARLEPNGGVQIDI